MPKTFRLVEVENKSTNNSGGWIVLILGAVMLVSWVYSELSSTIFYWDKIYVENSLIIYNAESFTGLKSSYNFKTEDYYNAEVTFKNRKTSITKNLQISIPIQEINVETIKRKKIDGSFEILYYVMAPKYSGGKKYLKPNDIILKNDERFEKIINSAVLTFKSTHKQEFAEWFFYSYKL